MKDENKTVTSNPNILTRIVAMLLVLVIMVSSVALIISFCLRSTFFSPEWYFPIIADQTFLTNVRATITNELAVKVAPYGIPPSVVGQIVTNDQVYSFLSKYIDDFVAYLDYRAERPVPGDMAELFSVPLMAYVRDLSLKLGITLSADQQMQLQQMITNVVRSSQARLGLFEQINTLDSAKIEQYHQLLYSVKQLFMPSIWALAVTILLLFLLFLRNFYRFLKHAMLGFWLAGAALFGSMTVFNWLELTRNIPINQPYFKAAVEQLLTNAADSLRQASLVVLIAATVVLVVAWIGAAFQNRKS